GPRTAQLADRCRLRHAAATLAGADDLFPSPRPPLGAHLERPAARRKEASLSRPTCEAPPVGLSATCVKLSQSTGDEKFVRPITVPHHQSVSNGPTGRDGNLWMPS